MRLSLFGSTARGTARPDSELDLLAAFDDARPLSPLDVIRIENQIADLLGQPVDLTRCEHYPGTDLPLDRRPRTGLILEFSPATVPSPQKASIRSGSSDCWGCSGGTRRSGGRRGLIAERPERRDGTGGISGTGTLRAINGFRPVEAYDTPDVLGRASTPAVAFAPLAFRSARAPGRSPPSGRAPRCARGDASPDRPSRP